MELDAMDWEVAMTHSHDLAFGCFRGYFERGWQRVASND